VEVEAGIEIVAVAVGDVLVFVGEGPRAGAGRVEELEAGLKIKIEIKLGAAGDIDGYWAPRGDETRGRGADDLEAVLAAEIQFEAEGIDAAAVDVFAADFAETYWEINWIGDAGDVFRLADEFDGDDVERVLERDVGPIVDGVAVAKGEDAELAIAGDADEVRSADGVAAPDAEFGVAMAPGGGGEGERGGKEQRDGGNSSAENCESDCGGQLGLIGRGVWRPAWGIWIRLARLRHLRRRRLAAIADLGLVLTDLGLAPVDSALTPAPAKLRRALWRVLRSNELRRDPHSKL